MSADYKKYEHSHFQILVFILAFIGGVLVSSFFTLRPLVAVFLLIIGVTIFIAERTSGKCAKLPLLLCLVFISFSLGVMRYAIKDFHPLNASLESQVGEEVVIEGTIISEPEWRDNSTRFVLSYNDEKILVSTDLYAEISYGDYVRSRGRLNKPGIIKDSSINSDQAREFDYAKYLSKDDIYYTLGFAKVEVATQKQGNPLKSLLLSIKKKFIDNTRKVFAEPEASLLAGLIVAGKDSMPKNILEEFRRAGVVHIVVLSGYNLTIIADFLKRFFSTFSLKASTIASVTGILLFVLMTGGEATVVRASILVLAVILAKSLGRTYSVHRALLFAAFVMILINPKILVFDPSFQLSFLATLALIYVAPIVEKYLGKVPEKFGVRGLLATTLATQVVVFPYLIYSMGEFSVVSIFSNMLVLLIIPITMFVGFLAVLISFISMVMAMPVAYAAHLFLGWILLVSQVLGNLSFSSIKINHIPAWAVVMMYAAMIAAIWRLSSSLRRSASLN